MNQTFCFNLRIELFETNCDFRLYRIAKADYWRVALRMTVKRKEMKLHADFKCNCFVCLGISSNSRMLHLFEDASTVDAPLTYWSHSAILRLDLIFVRKTYLVLFSYILFSKLLICCIFTNLVSRNNIIENVSIWHQGSILKPKAQSPLTFCLLVQTKMTVSRHVLYHLKTPIKQYKET